MVIDVITYNGEEDLFKIRYNILKDYVDEFIVVEFDKTFSGKPKEKLFNFNLPKVKYFFHTEDLYNKYYPLAESSPNTVGADHWKREFCQKESIKDALTHLKDDDIVFIGDCDEIWGNEDKDDGKNIPDFGVKKLKLLVYTYYLNLCSDEEFYGTIAGKYKDIKNECLNHLRTTAEKIPIYAGWHFTSIGGLEEVRRKLSDSYTEESYWNKDVQDNLEERHGKKDFLGRNFTYTIDESDWPQYLKDNREKWKHLLLYEK